MAAECEIFPSVMRLYIRPIAQIKQVLYNVLTQIGAAQFWSA